MNLEPPMAICMIKRALKMACLDSDFFLLNFWLILGSKWVFSCQIPPKWPTVINVFKWDELVTLSTILVNINASGWVKMVKIKNAFSRIFDFPSKNFDSPYLSSPTWHRGHSVLKIIVWISSLLTNITQHMGKHKKSTRGSYVSLI